MSVLGTTDASTTWSQGDIALGEMMAALKLSPGILKRPAEKSFRWISAGNVTQTADNERNDAANRELLKFWKNFFAEQEDRGALL